MARTAQFVDAGRTAQQLHWGGGTPTYLHPEDIRRLLGMMRQHFSLADDDEVRCEIDPRDLTREHEFSSINLDLIVGLPKQTVESFRRTLERVVAWAPDRLAVFAYAHVPWLKKHQRLIKEAELPDSATRLGLQQAVNEMQIGRAHV